MSFLTRFLLGALLFSVCAAPAPAQTIGLTASGGDQFNVGSWVLGYSFLVNNPINVTSLGVFDQDSNGLNASHEVGLWDSAGNLLASTTVPAGAIAILDSSFRFVPISSVSLNPGSVYYVGASTIEADGDSWLQDSNINTAPEISYDSRRYEAYSGTLVFPGQAGSGDNGYFGGNFQFAAVPEPTTWAMIGMVTLGTGLYTWKKRRQAMKNRFAKV